MKCPNCQKDMRLNNHIYYCPTLKFNCYEAVIDVSAGNYLRIINDFDLLIRSNNLMVRFFSKDCLLTFDGDFKYLYNLDEQSIIDKIEILKVFS